MDWEKMKEELKGAVTESLKPLKEEIDGKLKVIEERVSKIESLPINRLSFNVNTTSEKYKGYKLNEQMRNIRNRACKEPERFPVFSNPEKANEYAKFMIDVIKALRGDFEAKANLKEFYQKAAMQEGTASEGGYLVPDEYQMDLIQLARDRSFALNECTIVNMSRDTIKLPKEASLVSVAWTSEEGGITESEPTMGEVQLSAKRLDGYAKVSNELLQDSAIDIVGMLTEQFAYAIGLELDNQVLNGTGSPVSGVLTAAAGYSVVMSSGKTNFSSINADNLSEMISKMDEGYQANARYIFNKLIMHYIRILKDSNNAYIYAKPGNGTPGTIWEFPYFQSAKAPSTSGANTAFVSFGNFKYFYIGRRLGAMALDIDPYGLFTTYQTRFRMVTRWGLAIAMAKAFVRLLTAAS